MDFLPGDKASTQLLPRTPVEWYSPAGETNLAHFASCKWVIHGKTCLHLSIDKKALLIKKQKFCGLDSVYIQKTWKRKPWLSVLYCLMCQMLANIHTRGIFFFDLVECHKVMN